MPIAKSESPGQPDELRMSTSFTRSGDQTRKNVELRVRVNFGDVLALFRSAESRTQIASFLQ